MPTLFVARSFAAAVLAALVFALCPVGPALAGEEASERYGEGVTLEETTPIADLLADPDAYLGQRVRIEGRVASVCPKAGCWMELEDDGEDRTLRVKVDDGVIVFPADAQGRVAVAEGVLEAQEMSRDGYIAWLVHLAEERGETLDPAEVDPGEGPFRLIQLRGTGAEIAAADLAAGETPSAEGE